MPPREWEEEDDAPRRTPRARRRRSSVLIPLVIVGGTIISILAAVGAGVGVWLYWKARPPVEVVLGGELGPAEAPAAAEDLRAFWSAALPPLDKRPAAEDGEPPVGIPPEERGSRPPGVVPKPREVPANAPTQLSGDVLHKVKRATFLLRVTLANGEISNGSGFLSDATGIVVTNAHVLGMLDVVAPKPKLVEVFLRGGERDEKKVRAEVLGVDRRTDLGLLRIPKDDLPPPLVVKSAADLYETQTLWVSGFPYGELLGKNVTVTACPVSSLRLDRGVLEAVQVQGDMQPGNSGGPVVDASGDVVAVAARIIPMTRINFAVPADAVLDLARGQLAQLSLGVPYRAPETVSVPVRVHMHDPLQRIRGVGVELWIGDPGLERAPTSAAPAAHETDGPRKRVNLGYQPDARRGEGLLPLPPLPPGKVYWLQPIYEDDRGATQWAGARSYQAPPPVVRKPVHLERKPDGTERARTLHQDLSLRFAQAPHRLFEVGVHLKTAWKESQHASDVAGATDVRRQYTGLSLAVRYNWGKPSPSPLATLLQPHLETLRTRLRLDPDLRSQDAEFGAELTKEEPVRAHLQVLHALTQQKLDLLAVPLPGKVVQPGETWKPRSPRPLLVDTFEIAPAVPAKLPWTFTYVGTRIEKEREVAVVILEHTAADENGPGPETIGTGSGVALLDVETGRLIRVEARYQASFLGMVNGKPMPARTTTELRLEESTP